MSLDDESVTTILIAVLGVWRVTYLVTAEDGPWDVVARAGQLAGRRGLGRLLDCFNCCSLWVAVPWAAVLTERPGDRCLLWLAISGGAILVERATAGVASWVESPAREGGYDDGVLR